MRKARFTDSQIIKVLKEVEGGRTVVDVCREYGIDLPPVLVPHVKLDCGAYFL